MLKKLRKLMATFLSVVLLLLIFPTGASALTYNDFTYEYVTGGIAITGYNGVQTDVTIPDQINGTNVVEIADYAFDEGYGDIVRNIVLPEHLIRIGECAFYSNKSLRTVTFNQKLEVIDKSAFYGCSNLTTPISIPSLRYIGDFAFQECKKIPSFCGHENLTVIGFLAFYDCIGLTEVTVPKGMATLPSNTFKQCISINKIVMYDTLKTVNGYAFDGVPKNVRVEFIGSEASFRSIDFFQGNENVEQTENITFTVACEHHFEVGFIEKANCVNDGVMSEQCIYCKKKVETILPATNVHVYDFYYDSEPTCTSVGIGYEICVGCSEFGRQDIIVPKNAHEFSELVKYVAPTITKSGKWVYGCAWCNATTTVKIDPTGKKLTKAKITVSNKTYTGKAIKPTVTVKYSGKKLKKGTDYTVSYKNNKKIGTATAIINGKGKYVGTRTVTFKITPKKTSIKKLSSGKKKIKVKWGKVTNSSGYQIVVATNKGFSKNKKEIYVKSKSSDSKTITKLKAKKTYYVRLRAYKTVKGKKIYAPYTKTVKVKTK